MVGTVISGTLRDQDLVPAFLDELGRRDAPQAEKIRDKYSEVIDKLGDLNEAIGVVRGDERLSNLYDMAEWLMNDLFDALNEVAPEGYYFGTNEGDGADFGFWPMEDTV